jgi:MoaA/NifB/PqqE/SkfB family radical SAM enzyme
MNALAACRKQRLITGVATSVCASNFDDLVSAAFIDRLVGAGVLYLWYYIYRPAGARPCPELALTGSQIDGLRRFIVNERGRRPIALIDAYWDHLGRAVCPAAMGISHHINPRGDIEPCPPIQFAKDTAGDGTRMAGVFDTSSFLRHFRQAAARNRGCILLENPRGLSAFLRAEGARDTSGRNVGLAELEQASAHAGHNMPGMEIPERNFFYRFAKRKWFFGFGAYG